MGTNVHIAHALSHAASIVWTIERGEGGASMQTDSRLR